MVLPTSDLNQFQRQLDNPNQVIRSQIEIKEDIQRIQKNLVICYPSDHTGCGHIRCVFPMNYLNAVYPKGSGDINTLISPIFLFQHDILMRTRSIVFQRTINPEQFKHILEYKHLQKKYGYKLIFENDDFIYTGKEEGECIPDYNMASVNIDLASVENSIKVMELMDTITVSTEFLKNYLVNNLKIKVPVVVIQNAIPKYYWFTQGRRKSIKNKIEKPRVIYAGSPSHYCNTRRMKGDWDNAWSEWVIKSVRENKIEFLCMGGLPFFFESIENKIHQVKWMNSYKYHEPFLKFKPDFCISPLVPNYFNYSKSNLKASEASAIGAISIGTVFTNGMPSPYDNNIVKLPDNCSVEDIDRTIKFYSEPENFNKVIEEQYEYLDENGHWLESEQYINKFVSVL